MEKNSKNISKINLSGQGISQIPPYILKCKNLRKLNASHNAINLLPQELSNLRLLKNVDFSFNQLVEIRSKFFEISGLETVILNCNNLQSFPKQINKLTKLKKLSLSHNQLTELPLEIGELQNLESLNISHNKFSSFPESILKLKKLRYLWINDNLLTELPMDKIINELKNLKAIYCFNPISSSNGSDKKFSYLKSIKGNSLNQLKLIMYSSPDHNVTQQNLNAMANKNQIFISYSHKDEDFLREIETTLKGLRIAGLNFDFWSDKKLSTGDKWEEEIKAALNKARIAIVIVSRDFLASDFINTVELPTILKKAEIDGTRIMSIIARPVVLKLSPLNPFQTLNPPEKALSSLSRNEQEIFYNKLSEDLAKMFESN